MAVTPDDIETAERIALSHGVTLRPYQLATLAAMVASARETWTPEPASRASIGTVAGPMPRGGRITGIILDDVLESPPRPGGLLGPVTPYRDHVKATRGTAFDWRGVQKRVPRPRR